MPTLLESEFELGVDRINSAFAEALKVVKVYTPKEDSPSTNVNLQAIRNETALLPRQLRDLLLRQYEIVQELGEVDKGRPKYRHNGDNGEYETLFRDYGYDDLSWISTDAPRFSVALKSPSHYTRFDREIGEKNVSIGGYAQGIGRLSVVKMYRVSSVQEGTIWISTFSGEVHSIKWGKTLRVGSFTNTREITLFGP